VLHITIDNLQVMVQSNIICRLSFGENLLKGKESVQKVVKKYWQ